MGVLSKVVSSLIDLLLAILCVTIVYFGIISIYYRFLTSCQNLSCMLWYIINTIEIIGFPYLVYEYRKIKKTERGGKLKINLERQVFACSPGEKVRIITKVEEERPLEERNFKVFVDGNEVKIEKFRASGLSYELEISTPAEVGRHSGIVEALDGAKYGFDCFEIVVTKE
jgi:hypothetical protein